MVLLSLVGVVAGALLLAYLYVTRHFKYWASRGVTGPHPTAVFGNLKKLVLQEDNAAELFRAFYNSDAGAPFVGIFLLDKPALVLRDPEVIKNILMKDFTYFTDHYAESNVKDNPLASKGLFFAKGDKWKAVRAAISPIFTLGRMKKMFNLVTECTTELENYLIEIAQDSSPVEIKEVMAKTGTDVISSCAFGINSNTLRNPDAEFREFGKVTFTYTWRRSFESTAVMFLPWLAKLCRFCFFPKETTDFFSKVFWETLIAREKSKTIRNDMIDLIIQLKNKGRIDDEDPTKKSDLEAAKVALDNDDLLAQAIAFFSAGFETTSSTVTFTLYELALQPDIQTKLRQEIKTVLAQFNGQVTYDSLKEMKFLDMVVSETLRKYPPLPYLDRVCGEDYKVPGTNLTIEKGTPIFVPLLGLHYDPKYFPNPEMYDPERFSDKGKLSRPAFCYLPFGEGRRICIGMRFGLMSAKTELAKIISGLEVCPCAQTPIPLILNPKATMLATVGGIMLRFRPIK